MAYLKVPAKCQRALSKADVSGSNGTSYLPNADEYSETTAYFYFGWKDFGGEFTSERQDRRTLASQRVKGSSANFAANWINREILEYS